MLRTNKHSVRSILTTNGVLTIDRYCLRPKSPEDLLKLSELLGVTCIYPLDSYLRIDKLPFKMTLELMLSICEIAIESKSYEHAEAQVIRAHHIPISDDTIRSVVDDVGKIVYSYDCQMAMNAKRLYETGGIVHKNDMDGTLYLSTDGAYINTREVVNGSGWHECKLGLVFDSNHIENYHTAESDDAMRILQKRYVGLIGNVEDYKWQMLALALANGYGRYRNTALLADGAPWIRKMKEKLFPDSVQILDRFHLKENVGKYGAAMITGKGMADIRNEWIQETCEKLDKGEWKEVLIDLERRFKGEKPPAGIVNLPHYITENAECINYPAYRDAGFITSTAAMESSNKSVTQDRLKGPGMRWEIINGQGVLAMKAKKEGGEWKLVEKLLHNRYS